ncbi:MAG: NADH-quinone oxidoreductase subunit L, partial [Nitrospira sp.]|nr:NADH-quinone oxidoreductase subunit L [Nitrospira sp.]
MISLLWLIPALPLAGFLLLALCGGLLSRQHIAWVGCGSVGAAAVTTALVAAEFFRGFPTRESYQQTLWNWIDTSGMTVGISWHLDALSLLMVAVITGIGFLIHLYSAEYMAHDDGYARFFAYMNLFVSA